MKRGIGRAEGGGRKRGGGKDRNKREKRRRKEETVRIRMRKKMKKGGDNKNFKKDKK